MDDASYKMMEYFATKYAHGKNLSVCDVGSRDINGSYRPLFKGKYVGIDIVSGKNVDIVVSPYAYPFMDHTFDVVISGQALEHVGNMLKWMSEVARIAKDLVCIIAPWKFKEHRFPIDCWRILPDGMRFLFNEAGIEPIEIKKDAALCMGIGRRGKCTN